MDEIKQASYLAHFSQASYGKHICDYAMHEVFSHYMFIDTRSGYCTHCNKEFSISNITNFNIVRRESFTKTGKLKHNSFIICPHCNDKVKIKEAWRGRKYMIDEAYFIYYEKSLINSQVMIARGIYAVRDYRRDYKKVITEYATRAHYYFEMGNSVMFESYAYYSTYNGYVMDSGYPQERKNFNSLFNQFPAKKPDTAIGCSSKSIDIAIKGTPFQYSCYKEIGGYDGMVKYFQLYSKYPIIESLIKIGFINLVEAKLYGNPTHGAVNWRAKTIQKALRLNKGDIKQLRGSKYDVDCRFLRLFQLSKKDGSNLEFSEIEELDGICWDHLYLVLKYTTLKKALHYIKKQRSFNQKTWHSISDTLSEWSDYIKDCIDLDKDLKKDNILFPKDLRKSHQATTKLLKVKGSEILNNKIAARAKILESLSFEFNGLIIRPAASQAELIKEGDALGHCVASRYSENYANGKTNIFFIRKVSEPNKPFYTVEIKQNQGSLTIIQCRSKGNKTPGENKHTFVTEFLEAFKTEKLTKKKNRVKITA